MGLFKDLFKKGLSEADKYLNQGGGGQAPPAQQQPAPASAGPSSSSAGAPSTSPPPTRWEKAVFCLRGVVSQVSKIDHDGVEIVFVPGQGGADFGMHRGVRDAKELESAVEAAGPPGGRCAMGKAVGSVLNEAFERGFGARPTSVLVLTAGRPDDHEELTRILGEAAARAAREGGAEDLTVTFVQVGDDAWAGEYLRHLDEGLVATDGEGEEVDIVDTVREEDILEAMDEAKKAHEQSQGSGTAGALFGAFAGAALGAGGAYLANKMNAAKRTKGWGGSWKCTSDKTGEEVATLEVEDDQNGALKIRGWDDGREAEGSYADDGSGGYVIQFVSPEDSAVVVGAVEDEHTVVWDDGTRWEEIPPDGPGWGVMAGAAAAGAAGGGGMGYLLDKKFFHKASGKEPADYVVVVDRSRMMGRNPPRGPPPSKNPSKKQEAQAPDAEEEAEAAGSTLGGLSNKDAKYEDLKWAKIPVVARKALRALDYDRRTWDEHEWNDICEYWWEDLSKKQRRALETLGWDEAAWDYQYEESDWRDLPGPVKKAAKVLGFDEDMWDEGEWPDSTDKWWEDFTEEEQRALHVLGYYQYSWEG